MPAPQYGTAQRINYIPAPIPSGWVEYTYYFAIIYSTVGSGLGIEIPLLAAAVIMALGTICVVKLRSYAREFYAPIAPLLLCAISFVLVQLMVHDESLLDSNMRGFILGFVQLVIVYSLCLRQGFAIRFPVFLFIFGMLVLPFLNFNPGDVERARADGEIIGGSLSHPNSLGTWFGFCAVYFAIIGIETQRFTLRVGAWVLTVVSLLIVGLTVSRGPMFGAALAITFALRRLLKRGFVPVFVLVIVAGVVINSGFFDQAISNYSERAMEDTGRVGRLWPDAFERIPTSPVFGLGITKAGATPHNTFLYFALTSGVVPVLLFGIFWLKAGRSALHGNGREDDPFRIPYLLFAFVGEMLGDLSFMGSYGLIAVSIGAGSAVVYAKHRLVLMRAGNKVRLQSLSAIRTSKTTLQRSN